METKTRIEQLDAVLRAWLAESGVTVICGDWSSGSIMELLPESPPTLTDSRYPEPFDGLRDLHLDGQRHHVHLDLARFAGAVYTVAPSVCYGFKPSFELHLTRADDDPGFALAIAVRDPWRGAALARDRVVGYFRRVLADLARFGDVVGFRATSAARDNARAWDEVHGCLLQAAGRASETPPADNDAAGPDALAAAVRSLATTATNG